MQKTGRRPKPQTTHSQRMPTPLCCAKRCADSGVKELSAADPLRNAEQAMAAWLKMRRSATLISSVSLNRLLSPGPQNSESSFKFLFSYWLCLAAHPIEK